MINKILFGVTFAAIGALATYEWHKDQEILERSQAFMNVGPRFTARDGQELCERLQRLEQHVYGSDSPLAVEPCEYAPKESNRGRPR